MTPKGYLKEEGEQGQGAHHAPGGRRKAQHKHPGEQGQENQEEKLRLPERFDDQIVQIGFGPFRQRGESALADAPQKPQRKENNPHDA